MNEYMRIRNEHDRAVILAQLVQADARVAAEAVRVGEIPSKYMLHPAWLCYEESRDELWKLIGPAPEGEASE